MHYFCHLGIALCPCPWLGFVPLSIYTQSICLGLGLGNSLGNIFYLFCLRLIPLPLYFNIFVFHISLSLGGSKLSLLRLPHIGLGPFFIYSIMGHYLCPNICSLVSTSSLALDISIPSVLLIARTSTISTCYIIFSLAFPHTFVFVFTLNYNLALILPIPSSSSLDLASALSLTLSYFHLTSYILLALFTFYLIKSLNLPSSCLQPPFPYLIFIFILA